VRSTEARARQHLVRALHAWARGDRRQAEALARAAVMLEHSRLAAAVLHALGPP